jgi:hypothetical protein
MVKLVDMVISGASALMGVPAPGSMVKRNPLFFID